MAKQNFKQERLVDLSRAEAYLIGIQEYANLPSLETPINDVVQIATILKKNFDYKTKVLKDPSLAELRLFIEKIINKTAEPSTPILIYFACHGIAVENEDGIRGALLPSDAELGVKETWYDLSELIKTLNELRTRHLLLVLDCCFSGTIRWASKRRMVGFATGSNLTQSHFNYFLKQDAWQVITSAAEDQTALDFVRNDKRNANSPFAQCFLNGLKTESDLNKRGVFSTTELCIYLKERFSQINWPAGSRQHIGLFPLERHQNGEFLFCQKGFDPANLKPADMKNPYRGLNSYDETNSQLFFGRKVASQNLFLKTQKVPLVVVSGASGTGKSSLVKAGLIPLLKAKKPQETIEIIKPGRDPNAQINQVKDFDTLVIDQFEEIITQANPSRLSEFLNELSRRLLQNKKTILTVRIDFEFQVLAMMPEEIKSAWQNGVFRVPHFSIEELREVVIAPAQRIGCFFETLDLADQIVDEVVHYPGSLPLLSFTMYRLFESINLRQELFRSITAEDLLKIGGVSGALQGQADMVFDSMDTPELKRTLQNLMLRMTSLSAGEIAGKRVYSRELFFEQEGEDLRINKVIRSFQDAGLINSGSDQLNTNYFEPSHDALVRAWPRVTGWIRSFGEENLLICSQIADAASFWNLDDKANSFLWPDHAWIQIAKNWIEKTDGYQFNSHETLFILESCRLGESRVQQLEKERDQALKQKKLAESRARAAENLAIIQGNASTNRTLAYRIAQYNFSKHPGNTASEVFLYDILVNRREALFLSQLTATVGEYQIATFGISPDGTQLACGDIHGNVTLVDTGKFIAWTKNQLPDNFKLETKKVVDFGGHSAHSEFINMTQVSPDNTCLIVGSNDYTISGWILPQMLNFSKFLESKVRSVAYAPMANIVVAGTENSTVWVLRMTENSFVKLGSFLAYSEHANDINKIGINSKCTSIFTVARMGELRLKIWSLGSENLIAEQKGDNAVFSPNGDEILIVNDRELYLADAFGQIIKRFDSFPESIKSVRFTPDGEFITVIGRVNLVGIFDSSGNQIITVKEQNIADAIMISTSQLLTITKGFNSIEIKNWLIALEPEWVADFQPDNKIRQIVCLEEQSSLVIVEYGPEKVYNLNRKQTTLDTLISFPELGYGNFYQMHALSSSGHKAAGVHYKTYKVAVWDLQNGSLFIEDCESGWASQSADLFFSSDESLLIGIGNTISIWELMSGSLLWRFNENVRTYCSCISKDNRLLASGTLDGVIALWDIENKSLISTLNVFGENNVSCLEFIDDHLLLAASSSGKIKVLDRRLLEVSSFPGHKSAVKKMILSPNKAFLLSYCFSGIAKVWRMSNSALLYSFACPEQEELVYADFQNKTVEVSDSDVALFEFIPYVITRDYSNKLLKKYRLENVAIEQRTYNYALHELHEQKVHLEPEDLIELFKQGITLTEDELSLIEH